MSKILSVGAIGLVSAALFACGHVQTPSQERAQIKESARRTERSAEATGRSSGSAASEFGEGVAQGARTVENAGRLGAHEVGQTLTGQQGERRSEARSLDYETRMRSHGDETGEAMGEAGHDTGQAARSAGRTVGNATETTVDSGEHAVGTVRRAAGEQPEEYKKTNAPARRTNP
jgi:hypothetical protein